MPAFKFRSAFTLIVLAGVMPAAAEDFSTSIMHPTRVDPSLGIIAGKLPGSAGPISYYFAVDLNNGDLMTQYQVTGRQNGERHLTLQLLDAEAKIADSTFVRAGFGAKDEGTKSFAIDSTGRHVIRLTVEGEETGAFCVLMGGSAMPNAKAPNCPAPAEETAAAVPAPAPVEVPPPPVAPPSPPKSFEVITSKCEERLRVGSDFLFDFDRADVRPEADEAMNEVAQRIASAQHKIIIEGHTDGKGTDGYNQGLSERRAAAVRIALVDRGLPGERLITHGFGKSRPIAPNQYDDGADDPVGRQKNRRVEVVINTCS
jgi:outer membrane protein OmpA-like peptidoglycan-associated protein